MRVPVATPLVIAPTSDTVRAFTATRYATERRSATSFGSATLLQHVGGNEEVPCRTPNITLGDTAPGAFPSRLDQSMRLQRLQVIVHLLPSQADCRRNRGRRPRFRQSLENRGPDRIECDFDGDGVSEYSNVVHGLEGRIDNKYCQEAGSRSSADE